MHSCLIADDHALMRAALTGLVSQRWPEAIITQAGDFPSAWEKAAALGNPALCLVDLDMPGAAPVAGVNRLRAIAPAAAILVVTGMSDDTVLRDLIAAGVAGFAHKTASPEIMLAAMDLVIAGGRYLPPRIADLLLLEAGLRPLLTERQQQVIGFVAQGLSNKEIAFKLDLSPSTVKTYVAQAAAALGAGNRTDAAIKARENGIIASMGSINLV